MKNPIFRSTQNKLKCMNTRSLRRRVDYYLTKSSLKRKGMSAHSLRRTSVTLAMEAGVDLLKLQAHLDHASPVTTINYIARQERLKNQAAKSIAVKV